MPIGFNIRTVADPRYICPDKGLKKTVKASVYSPKFGDGYSQKLKPGINNLQEVYSLTFLNRTYEEIHAIKRFFELGKGTKKFEYYQPGILEPVTVVCDTYEIIHESYRTFSCTAVLNRVYDNPDQVESILYYVLPDDYVLQGYVGVG